MGLHTFLQALGRCFHICNGSYLGKNKIPITPLLRWWCVVSTACRPRLQQCCDVQPTKYEDPDLPRSIWLTTTKDQIGLLIRWRLEARMVILVRILVIILVLSTSPRPVFFVLVHLFRGTSRSQVALPRFIVLWRSNASSFPETAAKVAYDRKTWSHSSPICQVSSQRT